MRVAFPNRSMPDTRHHDGKNDASDLLDLADVVEIQPDPKSEPITTMRTTPDLYEISRIKAGTAGGGTYRAA
jgi:hypothetical protein